MLTNKWIKNKNNLIGIISFTVLAIIYLVLRSGFSIQSIESEEPFIPRRGRVNCSLNENGKWRWFGTQLTVKKD